MARFTSKGETRKKEILENFHAVLAEEGLEGASIAKVAARMGINPSLIIHYFSSKEEMVVALVDFILDMYEEAFLPWLREIEDPEERLAAAFDAIFGADWAKLVDSGVFYACYSLSFRNPMVKERFRKMYSRLREILTEEIAALMEKGLIAEGDPGRLANLAISLLEGYDFYRSLVEDDEQWDEFNRFFKENVMAIFKADHRE